MTPSVPQRRKVIRVSDRSGEVIVMVVAAVLAGGEPRSEEIEDLLGRARAGSAGEVWNTCSLGVMAGTGTPTSGLAAALSAGALLLTERLGIGVENVMHPAEASGVGRPLELAMTSPVTGDPVEVALNDAPRAGEYLIALGLSSG